MARETTVKNVSFYYFKGHFNDTAECSLTISLTPVLSLSFLFLSGYQSRLQYLCGNRGQKGKSVSFISLVAKKKKKKPLKTL